MYYPNSAGYYQPFRVSTYLHRDVWEHHNGPIPTGYEIHHRDHDKSNNAPSNLELVKVRPHRKHHMIHRAAQMGAESYKNQQRIIHVCVICEGEYLSYPSRESIYCSKVCKNRARYWKG